MTGAQLQPAIVAPSLPASIPVGPLLAPFAEDSSGSHVRVQIWQVGAQTPRPILWNEAVAWLCGDASELRKLLAKVFKALPYEAFFWECSPVSPATARTGRFEFVALPAPAALEAARADSRPFAEHLDQHRGWATARTFSNVGGDSRLVAPTWADRRDPAAYTHIARFFREAPEAQQMILLQEVGVAIDQSLQTLGKDVNLWVSTAGLAVYWLHVRLDLKPKYYQHDAYKNPNYRASDELAQQLVTHHIEVLAEVGPQPASTTCASIQAGPLPAPLDQDPSGGQLHRQISAQPQLAPESFQEGPLSARFAEDSSGTHVRVQIWQACAQAARPILWNEAVAWLRGDASELRKLLAKVFKALPYEAFFWECSPVS